MPTPDISHSLDKLFTAFPLHSYSDAARTQRKQQYQLYYERLRDLPGDLVERTILELVDTASFMPRIGTIRTRVQARIKHRVTLSRPEPQPDHERERCVKPVAEIIPDVPPQGKRKDTSPVTGSCPRIRDVDGVREPCCRPYEYPVGHVRWLRSQGEHPLCVICAGEYLARQGELRQREAIWAERLLAKLAPDYRPSPEEVKRLRSYGYGRELNERLAAIGAYSRRYH